MILRFVSCGGARVAEWRVGSLGMERGVAEFSEGEEVTWRSHGGEAVGKVKRKLIADAHAGGRQVRASEEEPQYLVKSDKSGGEAVHKPSALKKKKE